jgi:hypothetical protein
LSGLSLAFILKQVIGDRDSADYAWSYGIVYACHPIAKSLGTPVIGFFAGNVVA